MERGVPAVGSYGSGTMVGCTCPFLSVGGKFFFSLKKRSVDEWIT